MALSLCRAGLSRSDSQHPYHCSCDRCTYYFGQEGNWLKIQNDSSTGYQGGEIVSSPLRWDWTAMSDEGGREVDPWHLMQRLHHIIAIENEAPLDQRCGFHVHVYAADLTDRQLGRLYELVHHYEAVLFRLACGRYERHRGYDNNFTFCRPLSAFENRMEAMQLAKAKSAEVKESAIAKQKYVAANLMPVEGLGTVEFRLYESTKEARRMRLFVQLSLALVERARLNRRPQGAPLHLGDEAGTDALNVFMADLEQVEGFNTLSLSEDVVWQWQESPATWQPRHDLPPLRHFDQHGAPTQDPDRAWFMADSHGNSIPLRTPTSTFSPAPRVRLNRREAPMHPSPGSYAEAYDEVPRHETPEESLEDEGPDWRLSPVDVDQELPTWAPAEDEIRRRAEALVARWTGRDERGVT